MEGSTGGQYWRAVLESSTGGQYWRAVLEGSTAIAVLLVLVSYDVFVGDDFLSEMHESGVCK